MKTLHVGLVLAGLLLLSVIGCAPEAQRSEDVLDLSSWPEELEPLLTFQVKSPGRGLNACKTNCTADFDPGKEQDRCKEFCECIHGDGELNPTLGTIIRCAMDIQRKVLSQDVVR